ncbi:MAG: hypothetical protein ORN21_01545 [Methylophilaceae bacterium]|nr:hypothetical protein [Methylophilaceae bacterium]
MQGVCNAGGSPINEIGEPLSSASHSPVQTILQDCLSFESTDGY